VAGVPSRLLDEVGERPPQRAIVLSRRSDRRRPG
jgi:hypothetical protein